MGSIPGLQFIYLVASTNRHRRLDPPYKYYKSSMENIMHSSHKCAALAALNVIFKGNN
jgi:hypothetical protein